MVRRGSRRSWRRRNAMRIGIRIVAIAALATWAVGVRRPVAPRCRLTTLDPGNFHASLVQKFMYADVDSVVHVYAPRGEDVQQPLARIESFNRRAEQPTHWIETVYTGADYFDRMLAERAGNIVVIAGNNARKTEYIVRSVEAGFNVLADKPMARVPEDVGRLRHAFDAARGKGVGLYDVMTERYEVTTALQPERARQPPRLGRPLAAP